MIKKNIIQSCECIYSWAFRSTHEIWSELSIGEASSGYATRKISTIRRKVALNRCVDAIVVAGVEGGVSLNTTNAGNCGVPWPWTTSEHIVQQKLTTKKVVATNSDFHEAAIDSQFCCSDSDVCLPVYKNRRYGSSSTVWWIIKATLFNKCYH